MNKQFINFSIGRDYLPNWSFKEALREIYQNYIDYGEYTEIVENNEEFVIVTLENDYKPENLEFLQLGRSVKAEGSIGQHGEGLKMAMFVIINSGNTINVVTHKHHITGEFKPSIIGETFGLNIYGNISESKTFKVKFEIPKIEFENFKDKLITKNDIIYTNDYHGSIVNKAKGEIYSGGLYVTTVNNFSKSYDIKPEHLHLDRDRSIPGTFDVNYHASKINEHSKRIEATDFEYSDTLYIEEVSDEIKESFTPRTVGNNIQFTYKDIKGEEKILSNSSLINNLKTSNVFKQAISYLKSLIFKGLGIYDLLLEFEKKHVNTTEAKLDFEIILQAAKK